MTLRSRLFATVAIPVLSATLIAEPALSASLQAPFEVAQADDAGQADAAAQQAAQDEQQRLLQEQQAAQQAAEQQAAQEAQQAAEQQAAQEAQQAAEQQAAQEAQQAAEQQAAQEAQQAAEQQAAQEAQQAAEQQAAQEAQQAAEQQAAQEAQQAAEQKATQDAQKAAAQQAAQEAQKASEQQAAQEAQKAAEQQAAQEAQQAAEQQAAQDAQKAAEQQAADQKAAEEAGKAAQEQPVQAEPPAAVTQEQPAPATQDPATAVQEQQPAVDQPIAEQPVAEQPAEAQPAAEQPAVEAAVPQAEVPAIVDTRSVEDNQQIAADPSKTDETVVLPVDNGAAVLDSDKEADNEGGQAAREERRKQRAEADAIAPPASDAEAQAVAAPVAPAALRAAITEQGQAVTAAPVFALPGMAGDTTVNTNNTTINNTVINTTTVNNTVNNVTVVEQIDNRTVLKVDNQIVVRNDDRPRLRHDSEETFYEKLPRGRSRETIVRPGGARIVTIYNAYGDIIQRSRVDGDDNEYLMIYSPQADGGRPSAIRDIGDDLPPMRLRIPVRDYIIDTSDAPDRDYYDFLAEPPVERVERVYSIDEVKYSARLRDKVRRIDLDTITFASGSADVPLTQAKTLRKVATAMLQVLDKDPGETFLVEGHTDAVGGDRPNLILSDQRAESVADLLTEVYGIPPENLTTQGYGERFLKVKTQVAEQQNRRVTIRRVTSLIRPVARAN